MFFGEQGAVGSPHDPGRDLIQILTFVWMMLLIGVGSLIPPTLAHILNRNWTAAWIAVGTALFLMGSGTALGSFLGFLFGVPRLTVDGDQPTGRRGGSRRSYQPNTN